MSLPPLPPTTLAIIINWVHRMGQILRHSEKVPPPPCISYANVHNYYGPYAYCSLGQGCGLRTTHTTADTHVRRPHVLKLAIQDLWDASDLKKKFLVQQQGATCAEIGKCDDKPMSYVATLHFVHN